jgi:hypothetical protein
MVDFGSLPSASLCKAGAVTFGIIMVILGAVNYFSTSPSNSSTITSKAPTHSRVLTAALTSADGNFANEASRFFNKPSVRGFVATLKLFPKWIYFARTVAAFTVTFVVVVGLAIGLNYYYRSTPNGAVGESDSENQGNKDIPSDVKSTSETRNWAQSNVVATVFISLGSAVALAIVIFFAVWKFRPSSGDNQCVLFSNPLSHIKENREALLESVETADNAEALSKVYRKIYEAIKCDKFKKFYQDILEMPNLYTKQTSKKHTYYFYPCELIINTFIRNFGMAESFEEALIVFPSCFSSPDLKYLIMNWDIAILSVKAGELESRFNNESNVATLKNVAKYAVTYLAELKCDRFGTALKPNNGRRQ